MRIVVGGLLVLLAISCSRTNDSRHPGQVQAATEAGSPQESSKNVAVSLQDIDLSKIGHITPVCRVQDKDYNELPIVDQLIANGKESIPYLISKLEDETEIKEHVKDYWFHISVGDVAHIILTDFFSDYHGQQTIPGVGWSEFLECKNPKLDAEHCLRDYITKYGRRGIKAKWQRVWEENKDGIYWDEADRSFRVRAS